MFVCISQIMLRNISYLPAMYQSRSTGSQQQVFKEYMGVCVQGKGDGLDDDEPDEDDEDEEN